MSKIFIPNTVPSYIAESTDISGSKIDGVVYKGAEVYITDTGKRYIVKDDLTLEELVGESVTISGEVPISGSVNATITDMPLGGYSLEENLVSGVVTNITDDTPTEIISEPESGKSLYITALMVTNSGSAATDVNITSGSSGSTIWSGHAAETGGGFAIPFLSPLKVEKNASIYAACSTGADISVSVSISGYKA